MSDMTLSISNEQLKQSLFAFLSQKYVQTADDRQKSMELQYMTTETHDLCEELSRFIGAMGVRVAIPEVGSPAPADPCAKGWYAEVLRLAELYGEHAWNDGVEYQKKHGNNPTPPTGYPDDRTIKALHALRSAILVNKMPDGWSAKPWVSDTRNYRICAPGGVTCDVEWEDTSEHAAVLRDLAMALATTPEEPTTYPAIGSIWAYKGDPARLYEVMHIANVAHRNEAHAPHVVYRTCRKPENIWVRTVVNFNSRFVLVPAAEGN